jgi:uncharacterized protein YukJ
MVHRRKPADAVRHYGVLVGSVVDGAESPDGNSPHYEIWVKGGGDHRIAVNVQSVDDSEVLAFVDADFKSSGKLDLNALLNGDSGFRPLQTGPDGTDGLDYLRDNLFPIDQMRPIPAEGSGVSLKNLLDANVERAKAGECEGHSLWRTFRRSRTGRQVVRVSAGAGHSRHSHDAG